MDAKVEATKTFAELRRIGALNSLTNVGENMITPSVNDRGEVLLWDGHITTWGDDAELSDALGKLPGGATFDEVCESLADFPNNA